MNSNMLSMDSRVRMTYLASELKRIFGAFEIVFNMTLDHSSLRLEPRLTVQTKFHTGTNGAERIAATLMLLDITQNSRDIVGTNTSYKFKPVQVLQLMEFMIDTHTYFEEPTAHVMGLFEDSRKLLEFLDIGDHQI